MMDVMNKINSSEEKNNMAVRVTRTVPTSLIPSAIFFDATGSMTHAVILYINVMTRVGILRAIYLKEILLE